MGKSFWQFQKTKVHWMKKKQVIVVKNLRDLSPKKVVLVSHQGAPEEEGFEPSQLGNTSPLKPEIKEGEYVSRSILGDPLLFEQMDKKARNSAPAPPKSLARMAKNSKKQISFKSQALVTEEAPPAPVDYDSPSVYLSVLQQQFQRAEDIRARDKKKEAQLMTYLPVNEKFSMNREGGVMSLWQQRQRDWESIEADISKRVNAPKHHTLMMSKTDDFRIKREEYDLLQAAIPPEDLYGTNMWIRTLRGGSSRFVNVGHIFSGLSCEIEGKVTVPNMVRKPKPSTLRENLKKTKALDETVSLIAKRKQLAANLRTLRPHQVTQECADTLKVTSKNLFLWAAQSSSEYFQAKEQEKLEMLVAAQGPSFAQDDEVASLHSVDENAARIVLNGGREVVLTAHANRTSCQTISLTNAGNTAIAVTWMPQLHADQVASAARDHANFGSEVDQILWAKADASRAAQLSRERAHFFCSCDKATILPGHTLQTTFTFCARGVEGNVVQTWSLATVPRSICTVMDPSTGGKGVNYPSLTVNLNGQVISMELDEHLDRRKVFSNFLEHNALCGLALDEINYCLRRVRDPVRISDLQERRRGAFERINSELLKTVGGRYTTAMPIFVTPDRLAKFEESCNHISAYNVHTEKLVQWLRWQKSVIESKLATGRDDELSENEDVENMEFAPSKEEISAVSELESRSRDPVRLAELKLDLFPERDIEIFDCVTEDDITPKWDFSVKRLLVGVEASLTLSQEIEVLEKFIAKYISARNKSRAKFRKRKEKLAQKALRAAEAKARGDDEEEEEEQEEEEEEEEEPSEEDTAETEASKEPHQLTLLGENLMMECIGLLRLLVTRPVDVAINDIVNELLCGVFDHFDDWAVEAKTAQGIIEPVQSGGGAAKGKDQKGTKDAHEHLPDQEIPHVPPLPSPFTSEEGAKVWKEILVPPVEEPGKGKGKPAAAPAKKGKDKQDKSLGPSQEQITGYFATMHAKVREELLNMSEAMFEAIDSKMHQQWYARSQTEGTFTDIAVPRLTSDFHSKSNALFLCVDANLFAGENRSAFGVVSKAREQVFDVIRQLSQSGTSTFVIVCDSFPEKNIAGFAETASAVVREALLAKEMELQKEFALKRQKRSFDKSKDRRDLSYVVASCANLATLNYNLLEKSSLSGTNDVHVFVLEDLSVASIVPEVPTLPDLITDDDEAPLDIGSHEFEAHRLKMWLAKAPHRVKTNVTSLAGDGVAAECFSDVVAALEESMKIAQRLSRNNERPDWCYFTGTPSFLPSSSCLQRVDLSSSTSRCFLTTECRQSLIWSEIFQNLPKFGDFAGRSENDLLPRHLKTLFPTVDQPRICIVAGGEIRTDKFRFLDELIESVSSILLVGELALPFLALSGRIHFSAYSSKCAEYHAAALHVSRKARLRGVKLLLPRDVLVSDEAVDEAKKQRTYSHFDPDSRDDGMDYDGETKTASIAPIDLSEQDMPLISLGPALGNQLPGVSDELRVDGYIFDVGELSRRQLVEEVKSADFVLVWGTVGACEVSGFQAGQKALVTATLIPPKVEPPAAAPVKGKAPAAAAPVAAPALHRPSHTWVMGESGVEWFSRMGDADGELEGDLVGAGRLSFACRDSVTPVGVIGKFTGGRAFSSLLRRKPSEDEMKLNSKRDATDENDEEQDDD